MSEPGLSTSAAMLFERDDARVLEAFRRGEFDYVDALGEVSEADFFRVITERRILDKLAQSYPSPRERHDDSITTSAPLTRVDCGCRDQGPGERSRT
jgi:hypothetical protein